MTIDQEAKSFLVGSASSKYVEDIVWSYCPGENNPNYPKNFFVHQTRHDIWILQRGEVENLYPSFEEALKACITAAIEYSPNNVASRMLSDNSYSELITEAGI